METVLKDKWVTPKKHVFRKKRSSGIKAVRLTWGDSWFFTIGNFISQKSHKTNRRVSFAHEKMVSLVRGCEVVVNFEEIIS